VRRVTGSRLVIAPEAGHLLPLEVPTATAELIAGASASRLDV
jgi:pimeloyl-ACP methyl ester carboxylesterase